MKSAKIKILIVDDHDLIRQGLKSIISLDNEIEVVGEANNGIKAIEKINELSPDILLLDMKMPGLDGIEVLKTVKEMNVNLKVIMLTVENDGKVIREAINIGADGYILKESAGEQIIEAIYSVYNGDNFIDKSLVSVLFTSISSSNSKHNILDTLTKRELDVLLFMSRAYSNKEIGEKLFLSEKTIKNYITNIFRKLELKDRVQATIFSMENGLEEYYKTRKE